MKFSELLGDPEPERDLPEPEGEPISVFAPVPTAPAPATPPSPPAPGQQAPQSPPTVTPRQPSAAPPSAVTPTPTAPPAPSVVPRPVAGQVPSSATAPPTQSAPPVGGRTGLAEVNIRQEPTAPTAAASDDAVEHLEGLSEVVDDLLPSGRRKARK